MRKTVAIIVLCFVLSSCNVYDYLFNDDEPPSYKTKIAWDSGLYSDSKGQFIVDEDAVFFYERPPEYTSYALTRLNADTGALVWRSSELFNATIIECQPVAINGYIYVLLSPNVILCFDRETGEVTSRVKVTVNNKNLIFEDYATVHQDYIYLGLRDNGKYFVRLDVNFIDQSGNTSAQIIQAEVLWEPETGGYVYAKPVVYNNVVYTGTNISIYGIEGIPVELAGFDIDSKEMAFHTTFGGPEDNGNKVFREELGYKKNPIFIYDDVLYYLGNSIAAWNLRTDERLFRHVSTWDIPWDIPVNKLVFPDTLEALYYKGNIYFTGDRYYIYSIKKSTRNIHCINADTGNLVWNAAATDTISSRSNRTNPIIVNDKLYVFQYDGLFVYRPGNGKLIGVDWSFCSGLCDWKVLYNDYIIGFREHKSRQYKLVAVDVGK